MASQFATLTSVKGTLMVSKVLLTYLFGSKCRIQASQFTANHLTIPYIITLPIMNHSVGLQVTWLLPTCLIIPTYIPSVTNKADPLSRGIVCADLLHMDPSFIVPKELCPFIIEF